MHSRWWSVGLFLTSCATARTEPVTIRVETTPPGADVEIKRGNGQFELVGQSPVDLTISRTKHDRTAQGITSLIGLASVITAAAIAGGAREDNTSAQWAAVGFLGAGLVGMAFGLYDNTSHLPPKGLAEDVQLRFSKRGHGARTFAVNAQADAFKASEPKIALTLPQPLRLPAATTPRRVRGTPNAVVAVMGVRDKSGEVDDHTLEQLSDYLAARLVFHGYRTVPKSDIEAAIKQLKLNSYNDCYDEACQIELGKALAAEHTVAPSILRIGNECVTSAGVYDLRLEAGVQAATVRTACTPAELMRGFEEVATQLAPEPTLPPPPPVSVPLPAEPPRPAWAKPPG